MTAKPLIINAHTDATLNAEIAFWAMSAGFELLTTDRTQITTLCASPDLCAIILDLKDQDEFALDLLVQISAATKAKILVLTALEQKTVASIRRLFEAKAIDVIVLERAAFNTRLLADLLRSNPQAEGLDREALSRAICDGHVIAHYQPKVPFQPSVERYGVEALCRIEHPSRGLLFPDSFIPLAEAHGLILELTDAVTVHAFRSLAEWDRQGMLLRLAINISPKLLGDTIWFDSFQARCQEYAIDPTRITLEVTESSSQGGKTLALEILSRLRLKGFLLSIDDFGTGFSSLETLYKLPFGELKIDKGFVFDIRKSPEARTLIDSTVSLAKKLGLKICAEGVESEDVFEALRELNCDDAQGYHISKPLPADRVIPFLEDWRMRRRALRQAQPASKFANVHALMGELLAGGDDDDHTLVLSAAGPSTPDGDSPADMVARIPAMIMSGDMLKSLALVQEAITACAIAPPASQYQTLEKLLHELEFGLGPGPCAELASDDTIIKIAGGRSFIIGRQSTNAKADFAIPCRWLSRGEKNLRLFREGRQWLLEDLGSTNGHFIASRRLMPKEPVSLAPGVTRVEVGRLSDGSAPAWLSLRLDDAESVSITFGVTDSRSETDGITWVALDGDGSMALSARNAKPGALAEPGTIADISYTDGSLWITPRPGKCLTMSGVPFLQRVPLVLETSLEAGDVWAVRAITAIEAEALPAAASA